MVKGDAIHRDTSGVYTLTEREKIALGLKKPKPSVTVRVVIPVHHTSSGMIWETHEVSPAMYRLLREQYPDMEVIAR